MFASLMVCENPSRMVWILSEQVVYPPQSLAAIICNAFHTSPGRNKNFDFSLTNIKTAKNRVCQWGHQYSRCAARNRRCFEIKKYYCGGSAWYMFEFSLSEAIADIEHFLSKVSDVGAFRKGWLGVRSPVAVNHLLAAFQGKKTIYLASRSCRGWRRFTA